MPALWVLLVVCVFYANTAHIAPSNVNKSAVAAVFYVSNWFIVRYPSSGTQPLGHLWSLAVEEQFYILWPFALAALVALRRPRLVPFILATTIGLVAAHRYLIWRSQGWLPPFVRTDTRADALLIGAAVAWIWTHGWTPSRGLAIAATIASAGAAGMAYATYPLSPFWYRGGMTLFAVLVSVVVLAAADGRWIACRVLEMRPLAFLGRVSYGVYLWHFPIFVTVARQAWPWPTRVVVGLGGTAVATALSWRFVEQPAHRLRSRLKASRPSEPEARSRSGHRGLPPEFDLDLVASATSDSPPLETLGAAMTDEEIESTSS